MAKKQVRNKFRDRLGDYYLINREITKADEERYAREKASAENTKSERAPWSKKEKTMILITGVALVLIVLRFLLFQ